MSAPLEVPFSTRRPIFTGQPRNGNQLNSIVMSAPLEVPFSMRPRTWEYLNPPSSPTLAGRPSELCVIHNMRHSQKLAANDSSIFVTQSFECPLSLHRNCLRMTGLAAYGSQIKRHISIHDRQSLRNTCTCVIEFAPCAHIVLRLRLAGWKCLIRVSEHCTPASQVTGLLTVYQLSGSA
eukprot:jgi/Botrbrau1/5394/Bobra.0346s0054.1